MALSAKALGAPANKDAGAGSYGKLLRGQDVKGKEGTTIKVKCTGVREAPEGWNALAIMDITASGYEGFTGFVLNKTNTARLAAKVGDNLEKAIGETYTLKKVKTRMGDSLVIV